MLCIWFGRFEYVSVAFDVLYMTLSLVEFQEKILLLGRWAWGIHPSEYQRE